LIVSEAVSTTAQNKREVCPETRRRNSLGRVSHPN
jgi:hypothetical protein